MESAQQRLQQARQALAQNDPRQAFAQLRWCFRDPALLDDDALFGDCLKCLWEIGERLGAQVLVGAVRAALADPTDPPMLYDLGYQLLEHGIADAAACVLMRCHHLAPGDEGVVTELVSALDCQGHYEECCAVLRSEPELLEESFVCRYLLAFSSIMRADLDSARKLLPRLTARSNEDEAAMGARIEAMLARADEIKGACSLGPQDLRGWHYVLTGGILLHLSPYGFDEGMHGRSGLVQDSYHRCHSGILRLVEVMAALDLHFDRIFAAADRDSQILAAAASRLLELPLDTLTAHSGPGLRIAYDLRTVDRASFAALSAHAPGQLFYAHSACWTDPPPFAPDVLDHLYQSQLTPWGARRSVDAAGNAVEIPADERPVEEIAGDIVHAGEDQSADEELTRLLAEPARTRGAAAFKTAGPREPLWVEGPVKSSRFE